MKEKEIKQLEAFFEYKRTLGLREQIQLETADGQACYYTDEYYEPRYSAEFNGKDYEYYEGYEEAINHVIDLIKTGKVEIITTGDL